MKKNLLVKSLSGEKADLYEYYTEPGRRPPVTMFIDSLQKVDKLKVLALLNRFAEIGEIYNKEKFRHEQGPIYCFKSGQVRICCFFIEGANKKSLVLTNAFYKKSNKIPVRELAKAMNIYRLIKA